MAIEKGVLISVLGIAVVGIVGYKIIQKKNPKIFKKIKKTVSNIGDGTGKLFSGAKDSFRKGYASA